MHTNKQQGFTLVEMMVVIIIIGILSAIAMPLYQSYIENSQLKLGRTMLVEFRQSLQEEYLRSGLSIAKAKDFNGFNTKLAGKSPNNNTDFSRFFNVIAQDENNNVILITLPQAGHPYPSYIRMDLRTGAMQECKKAKKSDNAISDGVCTPV